MKIKNESGFTLTETLIAVGLVGVVAMALTGLMQLAASVAGNASAQSGKLSLEQTIRTVVSKADTCTAALASVPFTAPSASGPGVSYVTLNLPTGSSMLTVKSGIDLPNFKVKVDPNGFRFVVPAGSTPEVSGGVSIWTGVLELKTSKVQAAVGGSSMASSILSAMRVRVNASNQIVGCENSDSYVCPDGQVQMGPYSSQCMTPEAIFASMCPAGKFPVSNGASIDCRDAAQLVGSLCPKGQVAVSDGSGVTCKAMTTSCFGKCSPDGTSVYDSTIERVLDCSGGCWNMTANVLLCLPKSKYKKGDDEWMTFHQDTSMRRPQGRPCESAQMSDKKHANLTNGGASIKFDDTTWGCSNDQNCSIGVAE